MIKEYSKLESQELLSTVPLKPLVDAHFCQIIAGKGLHSVKWVWNLQLVALRPSLLAHLIQSL